MILGRLVNPVVFGRHNFKKIRKVNHSCNNRGGETGDLVFCASDFIPGGRVFYPWLVHCVVRQPKLILSTVCN